MKYCAMNLAGSAKKVLKMPSRLCQFVKFTLTNHVHLSHVFGEAGWGWAYTPMSGAFCIGGPPIKSCCTCDWLVMMIWFHLFRTSSIVAASILIWTCGWGPLLCMAYMSPPLFFCSASHMHPLHHLSCIILNNYYHVNLCNYQCLCNL